MCFGVFGVFVVSVVLVFLFGQAVHALVWFLYWRSPKGREC